MKFMRKKSSPRGARLFVKLCLLGLLTMWSGTAAVVTAQGFDQITELPSPIPAEPLNKARAFDHDGDGVTDVAFYRPTNGTWQILLSSSNKLVDYKFGEPGNYPVPGDYDGDQLTDIAIFHLDKGVWRILNSRGGETTYQWGMQGDVPVQADYDGDGRTDIAFFRPFDGTWHIRMSNDPTRNSGVVLQWGMEGDVPVAGDYDGDNMANIAVFRPSDGNWYIRNANGSLTGINWGRGGDIPVPADYDGDGKTDPAVFRGSNNGIRANENGFWYVLGSASGSFGAQWGLSSDTPVPGDYDGDGRTDFTVFRPEAGNWFASDSSGSSSPKTVPFGQMGDVPVSSGYVVDSSVASGGVILSN